MSIKLYKRRQRADTQAASPFDRFHKYLAQTICLGYCANWTFVNGKLTARFDVDHNYVISVDKAGAEMLRNALDKIIAAHPDNRTE